MVYDQALKVYVPVAWVLMTGATFECYYQAYHAINSDAEGEADPAIVGVDFETALFQAIKLFWPDAHQSGCNFHFKQALRRKMIDMRIPKDQISFALSFGVIDLLTVLPKDELEDKGIPFVRTMIADAFPESDMEIWDKFWDVYFKQ